MTTYAASVGAKSFIGFAAEVTPGTPVAATTYLPLDPDKTTLDYTQGRTVLAIAAGTLFAEQYSVEEEANATGVIAFPVFPAMTSTLLFLAGFLDTPSGAGPYTHVGTLTKPKPITVEFNRAGKSLQYAGLYPRGLKLSCSSKAPVLMAELTLHGLKKPLGITATTPVLGSDAIPYEWKHMGTIQTIAGTYPDVDDWESELAWDNQEFRGANTTALPTSIIVGVPSVTGKFTKLFKDDLDYAQYVAEGATPGPVSFAFSQSGGVSDLLEWSLTTGVYTASEWKQPIKGMTVEDFTFHQVDQGGLAACGLININAHAGAYTTT